MYQFVRGTWDSIRRQAPELELTPKGWYDIEQQEKAIRWLTTRNAQDLAKAGIAPEHENLYTAHVFGSGPAIDIVGANDNVKLAKIVGDEVIKKNPQFKGFTVGDYRDWVLEKINVGIKRLRIPYD